MALYSIVEPRKSGFLKVDNLHQIYWELSGNSNGIDAIYIHGGPGGGTSPSDRRYFDPLKYNTLIFDQRGCGKSTPSASLVDNTTWDLVLDIEKLRIMLGIESFLVFGGSWGSTLALSYAITHPNRVRALVLRGIFTLRKSELDWFYQQGLGASCLFPDYWAPFLNEIPENERGDLIAAYYKRLTDPDEAVQLKAAREWATWECATSKLLINDKMIAKASSDKFCLEFSRIECHYFVNKGYMGFNLDSFTMMVGF